MATTSSITEKPFEKIALAMSGGGLRAATYHLGTMTLLHILGLLENVKAISTVSGGTITGTIYATILKEGGTFDDFYTQLYNFLKKDELLEIALEIWKKREVNVPSKRQSLILAFAEAYDRLIFNGKQFGLFWDKTKGVKPDDFHLKDIIFNTTEFFSGTDFRFQKSARPAKIGNGNVWISEEGAKKLRMADILAASSCFPGGFEPIVLREDFAGQDNSGIGLERKDKKPIERLALMDGGIYDNQGLGSLMLADDRYSLEHRKEEENDLTADDEVKLKINFFTLFFISDVASAEKDIYFPDKPQSKDKGLTLKMILDFGKVLMGILPVLAISLLFIFIENASLSQFAKTCLVLSSIIMFSTGLGLWFVNDLIKKSVDKFKEQIGDVIEDAIEPFVKMPIPKLSEILILRLGSLKAILMSLFLKRVRGQGYTQIFGNPDYTNKRIASILTNILDMKNTAENPNPYYEDAQKLKAVADSAYKMPTTLWFKKDINRFKNILASGEFTACYQIMRFIDQYPIQTPELAEIKRQAILIWKAFVASPDTFLIQPDMKELLKNQGTTAEDLLKSSKPS